MKNLKRTLALALSLVLLLGTMTLGVGAITFADAEEIVHTEAVQITAGLGLFAGTGGKFLPKNTVTRAQMATVIVKMLRGSDFNADAFKGAGNPFTDTALFEGGWAEGYINACAQMGVVAGYGDGTYRPGQKLTTAEAVTMIINALKVDAGKGEWPLTVMSKAEQMKLFSEIKGAKPGTNEQLSRDVLASIVLQGLKYSPAGNSGYVVAVGGRDVTFDAYADALSAAASLGLDATAVRENVAEDTLANKTFEMKMASGLVVENQFTGADYTLLAGDNTDYDTVTDLDAIGHFVTIYYKDLAKEKRKQVYCVIDECETVTLDKAADVSKDYKAAFGKSTKLSGTVNVFNGDYTADGTTGTLAGYDPGTSAPAGTYVILDNLIISYLRPSTVYASRVTGFTTANGRRGVQFKGVGAAVSNDDVEDLVDEYAGMVKDDYVTYVMVNGRYVVTKMDSVVGKISRTFTNSDGERVLTVNGVDYAQFVGDTRVNNSGLTAPEVDYEANYALYVAPDGRFVGYTKSDSAVNLTTTVFLLGAYTVTGDDGFGGKVIRTRGRGVDMDGKEVNLPLAVHYDDNDNGVIDAGEKTAGYVNGAAPTITAGYYTVSNPTTKEEKQEQLRAVTAISTVYDKDTNPVYAGSRTYATAGQNIAYNSFTVVGKATYSQKTSRYILLNGSLQSSAPLTTTVKTGTAGFTNLSSEGGTVVYCLLSRAATGGAQLLETMVVPYSRENAAADSTIYVGPAQAEPDSRTADGWLYNAFNATNGAAKPITLNNGGETLTPGFYNLYAEDDGTVTLDSERIPAPVIPAGGSVAINYEQYLEDGLYNENVFYDQRMNTFYNDYLEAYSIPAETITMRRSTAGAKVIDCRTDEEIDGAGVGQITSLAQVAELMDSNPELTISMDFIYNTSSDKATAVYITHSFNSGAERLTSALIAGGLLDDGYTDLTGLCATPADLAAAMQDYYVYYRMATSGRPVLISTAASGLMDDFESYDQGADTFYRADTVNYQFWTSYHDTSSDGNSWARYGIGAENDGNQYLILTSRNAMRNWFVPYTGMTESYTVTMDVQLRTPASGNVPQFVLAPFQGNPNLDGHSILLYLDSAAGARIYDGKSGQASVNTYLDNGSGGRFKPALDTWYTVKLLAEGDTLTVKIWERGGDEPETGRGVAVYQSELIPELLAANSRLRIQNVERSEEGQDKIIWIDNLMIANGNVSSTVTTQTAVVYSEGLTDSQFTLNGETGTVTGGQFQVVESDTLEVGSYITASAAAPMALTASADMTQPQLLQLKIRDDGETVTYSLSLLDAAKLTPSMVAQGFLDEGYTDLTGVCATAADVAAAMETDYVYYYTFPATGAIALVRTESRAIVRDDFESYPLGEDTFYQADTETYVFYPTYHNETASGKSTYGIEAEEDGNRYLNMTSYNAVRNWFVPAAMLKGEYTVSMDFNLRSGVGGTRATNLILHMFQSNSKLNGGSILLYISKSAVSLSDTGNGDSVTRYPDNGSGGRYTVSENEWYTIKMTAREDTLTIRIWPRGTEEPTDSTGLLVYQRDLIAEILTSNSRLRINNRNWNEAGASYSVWMDNLTIVGAYDAE